MRRFNRFYTRQIGVLRKTFLDSPYSLAEARVLYEIASGGAPTASEIGRALDLDAGYLSRMLRNFEKRGLIRAHGLGEGRPAKPSGAHRRAAARALRRSNGARSSDIGAMLGRLVARRAGAADRGDGTRSRRCSAASRRRAPARSARYSLRAPRPGDFGWIVKRHAELYAQEYGWTEPFEGVCAQIVADFVNNYDPKRERCWIAEMDGENVGSRHAGEGFRPSVARIRLLLVDPKARGLGLGARLVDECIRFARARRLQKDHAMDAQRARPPRGTSIRRPASS